METPDPPPNDTPKFTASKQVATWHPMTSQRFLGNNKSCKQILGNKKIIPHRRFPTSKDETLEP